MHEKLGVEVDPEIPIKTANEGKSLCPVCNAPLRKSESLSLPVCPNCGTKPFER